VPLWHHRGASPHLQNVTVQSGPKVGRPLVAAAANKADGSSIALPRASRPSVRRRPRHGATRSARGDARVVARSRRTVQRYPAHHSHFGNPRRCRRTARSSSIDGASPSCPGCGCPNWAPNWAPNSAPNWAPNWARVAGPVRFRRRPSTQRRSSIDSDPTSIAGHRDFTAALPTSVTLVFPRSRVVSEAKPVSARANSFAPVSVTAVP
jgi:hypothetical protein